MGLGQLKKGRHQPITKLAGSWCQTNKSYQAARINVLDFLLPGEAIKWKVLQSRIEERGTNIEVARQAIIDAIDDNLIKFNADLCLIARIG
jgi:hypothetical protein